MFLSDLSINRPVLMTMALVALLLFGVIAFLALPLNLMPAADVPYVTIQTVYAGASPEQIESQITRPIEDEIGTVSQIKSIQSYSLDSASVIIVEFELSKDANVATQEIKDKIDLIIDSFPDDADSPVVQKLDITAEPVVNIIVSGDIDPVELGEIARTTVKDTFSRIAGVGSVTVSGAVEREIRVEFDNRVVYENGISLVQVGQMLAAANLNMPGGNMQTDGLDFSVNVAGQFESVEDVSVLEIATATGNRRLGSLAAVVDASADVRERTVFFDTRTGIRDDNSILVDVVKSPDGNPVEISEAVRAALPTLEAQLPEGVDLTIADDLSIEIRDTVTDTLNNILLGIVLTALVLLFFLHDIRSTLIVVLAMPMSIIPTFLAMNALGMTINLMSLLGISTAVGVLVMNSVVVLENIFRHKEMGHDRRTAAAQGTSEVVVAVVASTMTNIAVFVPMATMRGIAGLFLSEFALAVSFATIFSMLISFTLTPMLASLLLPEHDRKKHPLGDALERGFHRLERAYGSVLEKVLHSRGRSVALILATVALFVGTMFFFKGIPFEFIPASDSGLITVEVELPQGSDLDVTAETIRVVEERIADLDGVVTITSNLGAASTTSRGTHLATVDVKLVDVDERDPQTIIAARISSLLADIPGATIRVTPRSNLSTGTTPVEFYLQGDDSALLAAYASDLADRLEAVPGLTEIRTSSKTGKPEITLYPDRIKLAQAGLTVQELAVTVRAAVEGMVMTSLKVGGEEYDIRVTLDDEEVSGYEDIGNILVTTRSGIFPLEHFADVRIERGTNQVFRDDKIESIVFGAGLSPGYVLGDVNGPIEEIVAGLDLPAGYGMSWGGDAELLDETVGEFVFVFILAVVLTYMLLAAILEKFGQPFLILSTIPLSLIGVVIAFIVTGKTMNIVSMLAIVMLVGMVVNNAILILDYANQLRRKGMSVRAAILEAAPTKLKPILMANIATILGMLPLALGIGSSGVEIRQPMGIVSIGGLLAATFLSLFVIPALENAIESRKEAQA